MSSRNARDPWLDFLRAAAILAVLVHHIGQAWPVVRPWLYPYTSMGAKGVDLFFVLSGWLIGGLFWQERKQLGAVQISRFWARRWLRTIPPYLGGLALAWTAVWIYRGETFDFGYLVFLQNYYPVMPFFFISWSLCVEEHFYLLLPLLFYCFKWQPAYLMAILALLPAVLRLFEYPIEGSGFGYRDTATHLRADGLLLGFAAAYASVYNRSWFDRLRPAVIAVALGAAGFLALDLGAPAEYVLEPLLIAIVFLGLLVALVGRDAGRWFQGRPVAWMAGISYSIYLTHALVIHVFVLGIYSRLVVGEPPALAAQVVSILLTGWAFHLVFERGALVVRERWAPARIG